MARNPSTDAVVDEAIDRGDVGPTEEPRSRKKREPTYQMRGDSRVPVSAAHGKLWKSRQMQALGHRKKLDWTSAWDEAIRYYRNDQTAHRSGDEIEGDGGGHSGKMSRRFSETENIVFANTSALVPTLYAKNPTVEFTAYSQSSESLVPVLEKLIPRLFSKRASPGVNLKPKMRRGVVMSTLTNVCYFEVGYTFREQSSEQAMQDLMNLSQQLMKAKTPQDVERIEGHIAALEEKIDFLRPAGPWVKFRRPHDVLVDPDASEEDHSDAKWMMVADFVSTSFLNAVYGEKKGDTVKSIYKPTHVLITQSEGNDGHNSAEVEINQYSMLDDDGKSTASDYGYNSEAEFVKAQRTKVWYVWDRVTQRVLMYNDKDWTWPIWVWDDPYRLQGFFPIYKMQFYTDPEEVHAKSEVTYYLDQQDALNQINSEFKQARQWARRNLFYDKSRVSKDEVEKLIKGDEDVAVGVDVPEGMSLKDFVQSIVPPSMQFAELFDKQPILEAIDRVASVQPVMRGVEFKTNTTNQAIQQYNSVQQTRLDEKIDAVEDVIGKIGWAIAQLCLQHMPQEQVAGLIGEESAVSWRNMDATEIDSKVQMRVTGGSTIKPTSEGKKQQAMQVGQVLGQFVNAAPGPVLMAMVGMMRKAFNDVVPDNEWDIIMQAIAQQAQQPAPPQGGGGESGDTSQPKQGGQSPNEGGGDPAQAMQAIEQAVAQLPPEARQALGSAVGQGVPISAALERIIPATQAAQGTA